MKSIRQWLEEDAGSLSASPAALPTSAPSDSALEARRIAEAAAGNVVPFPAQSRGPAANHVASARTSESDRLAQAKRVLSQSKLDIRKLHNDGDPEGRNLI